VKFDDIVAMRYVDYRLDVYGNVSPIPERSGEPSASGGAPYTGRGGNAMQSSVRVLLATGALLVSAGAAWAQSERFQPPTQTPGVAMPGFTAGDPRPGTSGGSPASSGSNTGSNMGAGATASPVGNDVTPPGAAPDIAEAPRTQSLFGLSRGLP
jgi:hypothetical protein